MGGGRVEEQDLKIKVMDPFWPAETGLVLVDVWTGVWVVCQVRLPPFSFRSFVPLPLQHCKVLPWYFVQPVCLSLVHSWRIDRDYGVQQVQSSGGCLRYGSGEKREECFVAVEVMGKARAVK